ncbi:MAG: ferrochelatase [Nannocystaceae bacterium]|nr:ferrochelatase [Nannocystaceae bacterium]
MMAAAVLPGEAYAMLARADHVLETDAEQWRTLDPARARASTLVAIGERVLGGRDDAPARAFAQGLVAIATAMREAFPDNLLWDLDFLGASLWMQGQAKSHRLLDHAAAVVAVQHLFGRNTAIGFAYVHDFTYGYDWAKWVGRDRAVRAAVAPFSPEFVAVMHSRGDEQLAVIAAGNDTKYPPLTEPGPRNPFGFSRAPVDELRLHRYLAQSGSIPVRTWESRAQPQSGRNYAEIRRVAAVTLGLT